MSRPRPVAWVALAGLLPLLMAATPPREGGRVRLLLPGEPWDPVPAALPAAADLFLARAVFEGLTRPSFEGGVLSAVARSWEVTADAGGAGGELWRIRLDPLARFPDGRRVSPEDVIRSWKTLLRSPISPYRFLLSPVRGVDEYTAGRGADITGLVAAGDALEIHLSRPAPDLLLRLSHPALGVSVGAGGAGPFTMDDGLGGAGVNRYHARGRPFLHGFTVAAEGDADAGLQVEAGEADAALLFGRAAGGSLERTGQDQQLRRLPGWDRAYALSFNPSSGFFRSLPQFRQMLSSAVDREAMLSVLFDGRGATIDSLLPGAGPAAAAGAVLRLPGTKSRLILTFDRSDHQAHSIAARVKAVWESMNLVVNLEGLDPAEVRLRRLRAEYDAAIVLHQPALEDPALALRETLETNPTGYADALRALEIASGSGDPAERLARARAAEALVMGDGRLAPLVRLEAWMLLDGRLVGLGTGPPAVLSLDDAFLKP